MWYGEGRKEGRKEHTNVNQALQLRTGVGRLDDRRNTAVSEAVSRVLERKRRCAERKSWKTQSCGVFFCSNAG
jgi:hypothetical protein